MGDAAFIAGDWGTSHLRLCLCDAEGTPLDHADGPGAAGIGGDFAAVFDSLSSGWQAQHGTLTTVLCGMVGSSIGWTQTSYVGCPVRPAQIADACVELRGGRVHIVPGLSCRNRLDAPDVMRGEETQILGALHLEPSLREGRHLLCLPGTHTKWALLEDGAVTEFLTAPTGEMFALICDHSVLAGDGRRHAGADAGGVAFEEGLAQFLRVPHAQLLHRIFECRSRRLSGELAADSAASYLSGLLIASDCTGALQLFANANATQTVQLIGTPGLTSLYAKALASMNYEARHLDGAAASLAGLTRVYRLLNLQTAADAN
jgi:2-dehydro-3-deoxygalactonokinase